MNKRLDVSDVIADTLQVKRIEIVTKANFMEDLGADSLDLVELILGFEERFDVEISDEDAEKITTVQEAFDYIMSKIEQKCSMNNVCITEGFVEKSL